MIQGGSVIIADAKDVWGNVTNMGLGEHAVRINAPPMFYDKKGNILRYIDFESATPNYIQTVVGTGTGSRSTDTALTGDFSLKMDCPAGGDYVYVYIKTHDFNEKTAGAQLVFSAKDTNGVLQLCISFYSGTLYTCFRLSYSFTSGLLVIYSNDHAPYYVVDTLNINFETGLFSTVKLTCDFSTGLYKSLKIFGQNYDISSIVAESFASAVSKRFHVSMIYSQAAGATTLYADNVIITENE